MAALYALRILKFHNRYPRFLDINSIDLAIFYDFSSYESTVSIVLYKMTTRAIHKMAQSVIDLVSFSFKNVTSSRRNDW